MVGERTLMHLKVAPKHTYRGLPQPTPCVFANAVATVDVDARVCVAVFVMLLRRP
jgi:hypothetical protein